MREGKANFHRLLANPGNNVDFPSYHLGMFFYGFNGVGQDVNTIENHHHSWLFFSKKRLPEFAQRSTSRLGGIIQQLNKRFCSNFNLFPDQDKQTKDAVFEEIDRRNRQLDEGKVTHQYRPDNDKENLKKAVDIQENSQLYQQALRIYQKYTLLVKE